MIEVFISYSHEDKANIDPVVDLLRGTMGNVVFQDYRNIEPGKKWRQQLLAALDQAKKVLVFWCEHASKSAFVKEEYEIAIKADKDVLPLLMDDTKVPPSLQEYQWIDLRKLMLHAPIPLHVPIAPVVTKPPFSKDRGGHDVNWEGDETCERIKRGGDRIEHGRQRSKGLGSPKPFEPGFAKIEHDRDKAARLIAAEIEKRWLR